MLDDIHAQPVEKLPADAEWITVPAAAGEVRVRVVQPRNTGSPLPVVPYMHGGGRVRGNAGTHDRLVRELADGARAAIVFAEYDRSPVTVSPLRHRRATRGPAPGVRRRRRDRRPPRRG
ncbi:hypothetical protein GCM10010254_40080 [Streptomyces chromofuscus]|nr:hypothetical protein GCM10010254_40080 [Streptomyces chromofuscus]